MAKKPPRFDVNNGRTLCRDCDKIYGYNFKRDNKNYENNTKKETI